MTTPFGYIVTLTTGGRTECMDEDQVYEALAEDGQLYDFYIEAIRETDPDTIYEWLFDSQDTRYGREDLDEKVRAEVMPLILDGTIDDDIFGEVMKEGFRAYIEEVQNGTFPEVPTHTFKMDESILDELK